MNYGQDGQSDRRRVFLSNGFTGAIESDGSIEWFPCPKFDAPSIFSRILDHAGGGHFSLRPESKYRLKTSYIDHTLIVRNIFRTGRGKLESIDFLPIGNTGIVRLYESTVPFIADINPIFNYGMINPGIGYGERGITFKNAGSNEGLEVSINGKYEVMEDGMLRMAPGKGSIFALYSKDLRYGLFSNSGFVYPEPYDALIKAKGYWRAQLRIARKVSIFKEAYGRSVAVILGLMYLPSGAVIAAPTTSLPEIIGQGRNWDYRYVWIRDAAYAAEALVSIGYILKARRIINFLVSVLDPSSKSFNHPLYSIDGTSPPPEEKMEWLSGNHGSKPVRVGNSAYVQSQMDTEGAFMDALYTYISRNNDVTYALENWWAVEAIIEWTGNSWKLPSTSLWEEREVVKHFVHTKVMQWVVADRASKIARMVGYSEVARKMESLRECIKEDVIRNGFSKAENTFTRYYGSKEVDAALLTLPLYGFIDAKDPMFLSTLKRIERDLVVGDGLVLRYTADSMGRVIYPFTLLSTWLARVYIRLGERKKAEGVLRALIRNSTDQLLFAEHVDPKTREPRGNFPQLFPHAGLVQAVSELDSDAK